MIEFWHRHQAEVIALAIMIGLIAYCIWKR